MDMILRVLAPSGSVCYCRDVSRCVWVWLSVEPSCFWFLILRRNIVISSMLCNEVFVNVAAGSVAVAGLRHNTPPVLHIVRIAITYCCDMCTVCVALCIGKVAQGFGPTLICLTKVAPSPRSTGNSKFPVVFE
jgi:hypothetical protein